VVTIGLSLTIPFAMLGDFLRGRTASLTSQAILGAVLVIVGFGLMGLEGFEEGVQPDEMGRVAGAVIEEPVRRDDVPIDRDMERGRTGARGVSL
jgi:hypothetical protein